MERRDPGERTLDEYEMEAYLTEIRADIRKDLVSIVSKASEALVFLESGADVMAAFRVKDLARIVDHIMMRNKKGG